MPYTEKGKQAALAEFGITKEAAMPAFLAKLLRRGAGRAALPGAGAPQIGAKAVSEVRPPSVDKLLGDKVRPDTAGTGSEALREQMMAKQQAAAANSEAAGGGGMLSKIPWWGKAVGAGAVGYGGYRMLRPKQQGQQAAQQYYGF